MLSAEYVGCYEKEEIDATLEPKVFHHKYSGMPRLALSVCLLECESYGYHLHRARHVRDCRSVGLQRERERNVLFNDALNTFYLRLYGVRTILIVRKETRCRHIGYSYRLTARVLLYAPSHRQDSTYHGVCYTSRGALAGTRNSSMGPPHEGSIRRPTGP